MAKQSMPHTLASRRRKKYVLVGKKRGYDELAYDALIGILGGIASWKYGVDYIDEKYRQILIRRGQKTAMHTMQ
ncbi:hypothetical protein [Thermococcus sp.]